MRHNGRMTRISDLAALRQNLKAERREREADWEIRLCAGGGCLASGEPELKKALEKALAEQGVTARLTETGCQGPCAGGPVATVSPGQVLYENLTPDKASDLVRRHLKDGELLEEHLPESVRPGERARLARRSFRLWKAALQRA